MLIQDPPVKIAENLWMLGTRQYPVYLFTSERDATLVEGGISAVGPVLLRQLQELGIGPEAVTQLIVTHAHPDHVMAVPFYREVFPNVVVFASEIAAQTLGVDKAVGFFCKMDDALTANLTAAGLIEAGHERAPLAELKIAVDRPVGEGDRISAGEITLNVLATPGHSDCSLSFHDPAGGILLISDATGYYLADIDDWWPNYFSDYGAYLDSMRRLADLEASVLCLSHNAVIQGADEVSDYFRRAIASTEAYHDRIVSEIKDGKEVRELAGELGSEAHARTPLMPVDFFQKNCALLVKKSLAHEGLEAP
jgi:glyoxylase-like metal-dependent hydrolase (beta-lactamase superfamily II)